MAPTYPPAPVLLSDGMGGFYTETVPYPGLDMIEFWRSADGVDGWFYEGRVLYEDLPFTAGEAMYYRARFTDSFLFGPWSEVTYPQF